MHFKIASDNTVLPTNFVLTMQLCIRVPYSWNIFAIFISTSGNPNHITSIRITWKIFGNCSSLAPIVCLIIPALLPILPLLLSFFMHFSGTILLFQNLGMAPTLPTPLQPVIMTTLVIYCAFALMNWFIVSWILTNKPFHHNQSRFGKVGLVFLSKLVHQWLGRSSQTRPKRFFIAPRFVLPLSPIWPILYSILPWILFCLVLVQCHPLCPDWYLILHDPTSHFQIRPTLLALLLLHPLILFSSVLMGSLFLLLAQISIIIRLWQRMKVDKIIVMLKGT